MCASPSCNDTTSPRNWLGVCTRCTRQPLTDPAFDGPRIASIFDEPYPGAQDELDQRHIREAEAPTP